MGYTDVNARSFYGVFITDEKFYALKPRDVFHKQLQSLDLPDDENCNSHVLFRKKFTIDHPFKNATVYICADDYYKLYINGEFVDMGPAPSYFDRQCYNTIDVTRLIKEGENLIAVHTYYHGLINRVYFSGDYRHGLLLDLDVDGVNTVKSDESFLVHEHTAYTKCGLVGYNTQFMEDYNSNARETRFSAVDFDDSYWENARKRLYTDYILVPQPTEMLEYEKIVPVGLEKTNNKLRIDFGAIYVGYLHIAARGKKGDEITVLCGQETDEQGDVLYKMRCNCTYKEHWILSGEEDYLDWFDYKSMRYAELRVPDDVVIREVYFTARHYPFAIKTNLSEQFRNEDVNDVWNLCVNSVRYGVQELVFDCMDREKGTYLGDGCFTSLAHYLLTGDDSVIRKFIDDGFFSGTHVKGLLADLNCSFMQEIAEYPLMLVDLVLQFYRLTGDKSFLAEYYPKSKETVEFYRNYEKNGLLKNLDRWCVVEWPENYQDGYAVDIQEGKVCEEPHIAVNAYYLRAIHCVNEMTSVLGVVPYRNEKKLKDRFYEAFYDYDKHVFYDGIIHRHVSYVGNVFPFSFGLIPEQAFTEKFMQTVHQRGISDFALFCSYHLLRGLKIHGFEKELVKAVREKGAWKRMIAEGASRTFEGWGKDVKRNASLFHLCMCHVLIFMCDKEMKEILR